MFYNHSANGNRFCSQIVIQGCMVRNHTRGIDWKAKLIYGIKITNTPVGDKPHSSLRLKAFAHPITSNTFMRHPSANGVHDDNRR